ncbi:hypothetical protein AX16_009908 [Volvariella volvacea WC 439]|nr:hypothetical protein AX16_009908 [Volvariella volvacea WC 439]
MPLRPSSSSITYPMQRPSTGRLWPAQSRPTTARPTTGRPVTAVSTRYESSYVVAVIEGRGIGREVGLAALDRDTGQVNLVQLADCQTYVKTLHQMHIHNPCLILVPDTSISNTDATAALISTSNTINSRRRQAMDSVLVEYMREEFPNVHIEPIGRRFWNDVGGLDFVLQLCVEDDEHAGTLIAVTNKYYALCAACALFKYAELKLNTRFSPASLRIRYKPVDGTMMIDPETAKNLELVENLANKKSSRSLFGILNHTYTAMASRLLRVNLVSPITLNSAIDARLDVVQELIRSEDKFNGIKDALKMLNKMDFDKIIASLASSETRTLNSVKPATARVAQILNLRTVIKNLEALRESLEGSQSQLLQIIHEMISDDRLELIGSLVCSSLNEGGVSNKGGIGAVNARVYAVKANQNRLLDVARETYKENVGDIYELSKMLTERYNLPLVLVYQETGFVFALKKSDLDESDLPDEFINASARRGRVTFTSIELKKMNARMRDALDETLILSEKIIQELLGKIVHHIGALYKASEAVALVDMLWSFAHVSISRPEFTGTLAIKSGRHPILETIQPPGTLVPNDVYCDDSSSFQMIQGPNMSGKSTYLRQIGLLIVMAMAGCFVPAEYASFRVHDALLTRLSNDDDPERGLSTFANEMASSAMILGLASPRSLVLIDELGRGTSPQEGIGISHAIAEGLIALKPFVFFATHFSELTTTLSRQPTMVNLHLLVQRARPTSANFGMTFRYKIIDGAAEDMQHYGLDLARLADLPKDVLIEGKRVAELLTKLQTKDEAQSESNKIAMRRKALLRLRNQLAQVLNHSALPDQDLLPYLARFQQDIAKLFMRTTDLP